MTPEEAAADYSKLNAYIRRNLAFNPAAPTMTARSLINSRDPIYDAFIAGYEFAKKNPVKKRKKK